MKWDRIENKQTQYCLMKLVIVSPRDQPSVWKTKQGTFNGGNIGEQIYPLTSTCLLATLPTTHAHTHIPGCCHVTSRAMTRKQHFTFVLWDSVSRVDGRSQKLRAFVFRWWKLTGHKAIHHRPGREMTNHQESRWGIQEGWHVKQTPTMCWHRTRHRTHTPVL